MAGRRARRVGEAQKGGGPEGIVRETYSKNIRQLLAEVAAVTRTTEHHSVLARTMISLTGEKVMQTISTKSAPTRPTHLGMSF